MHICIYAYMYDYAHLYIEIYLHNRTGHIEMACCRNGSAHSRVMRMCLCVDIKHAYISMRWCFIIRTRLRGVIYMYIS